MPAPLGPGCGRGPRERPGHRLRARLGLGVSGSAARAGGGPRARRTIRISARIMWRPPGRWEPLLEKIIRTEGKRNSILLYTGWGGTNQELQNTDTLKKEAESIRKVDYKGRFEIGATIGSHAGPVFGIGIISKVR